MNAQIKYLMSQGHDLLDLIQMSGKELRDLYMEEIGLNLFLLDTDDLGIDEILTQDTERLLAA